MALFLYFHEKLKAMKKWPILTLGFLLVFGGSYAQVVGKWKTIDDETNEPKSIVELFEREGKIYGKIIKLFRKPGEDPDPICDECSEDDIRFKKKIIGMEILRDMMKSGVRSRRYSRSQQRQNLSLSNMVGGE
jgi:Uncharacterized protein conserved in bacteria (DUF2147)